MGTVYRHTQVSRITAVVLGIASAAALWWRVQLSQPALLIGAALIGCVLLLFSTLTVVVRDQTIHVCVGPGLIRRRIPLRRIRAVRVVRTPWYYGWGIRLTPSGWLWNVSGQGGVEIQSDDGRCFRIGSDEPERLAEILQRETRAV
jgi:hypothetical protein